MAEAVGAHPGVQLTGAFDLFGKSLEAVKRNINTFAILYIIPLIFTLMGMFSDGQSKTNNYTADFSSLSGIPGYALGSFIGIGFVLAVIIFVVAMVIQAMLVKLELEAAEGKTPTLQQLFQTGKKYWLRLVGLSLVVGVFILGGLLLLIVPGFIMIRRYFLAPYFLIDQDLSISEAMASSAAATKPHSGYIWSIIGVSILLSLPSIVPVIGGLVAFVLGLIYSVAPAFRYHELKHLGRTGQPATEPAAA